MKLTLVLFFVLCASQLLDTEENGADAEYFYYEISDSAHIGLGVVFIGLAILSLTEALVLIKKGSDLKFIPLAITLFTSCKSIVTFIPERCFFGNNGIALFFVSLPIEIGYALSFATLLSFWGYWLMKKRDTSPTTTNIASSAPGMIIEFIKDTVKSAKTKEGWFFFLTVTLLFLFSLLGINVGAHEEMNDIGLYFSGNLTIVSSGIAVASFGLFGIMYPTKFFFILFLSIVPFIRMLLSFIMVLRGSRFGSSSQSTTASFTVITILIEVLPVIVLELCVLVLSYHIRSDSHSFISEPMLASSSLGDSEKKLASALGFMLDDDFNSSSAHDTTTDGES